MHGEIVNVSTHENYMRPDYTKPYKPKKTSTEFFSWVNVNIPNEKFDTPKMHYQIIDYFFEENKDRLQAMVHR